MIQKRVPGKALSRDWYTSEIAFNYDMKYLWKKNWLFAAFECQIPHPGDYVTYQVSNESVILIRGDDNNIRAFFNVCRHRGARVCNSPSGTVSTLTCPYHSWTYNRSGKLIKAAHMDDQISFDSYGLFPCNIRTVEGLIFINLSDNPLFALTRG